MARSYAQLHTSIWQDRDFCALPAFAQRVYLLLISQPTVSYAGVLAYTERRFAAMAVDTTKGEIADAMCVLEDADYLVTDDETEEVWVRSWCRYNGVLDHPNLRKAMAAAYDDVLSPGIRAAIFAEYGSSEKVLLTTPAEPDATPTRWQREPDESATVQVTSRVDLDLDLHCSTSPSSAGDESGHATDPTAGARDEDVIHAACRVLAERKMERLRGTPGEVHVPSRWLPPVIEETWRHHVENAERIVAKRAEDDKPALTADQLADVLEPPANFAQKEAEPHPLDEVNAAAQRLAADGVAYTETIAAIPRDPEAASRMRTIRRAALHGEKESA